MSALLSAVFLGTVVGSIYSLTASGLVLTYRTSGILNFAHGALGMFFSFAFFQATQGGRLNLVFMVYDQTWTLPAPVAMILIVGVVAPAVGWLLDVILFRRLRGASSVVKIVATIGVLISTQGVAGVLWSAGELTPRSVFPDHVFDLGGFRPSVQELATVGLAVALAAGLLLFLRSSRLGVRMRAVVDRTDLSEMMGVDSGRVSGMSWAIGTGFAALAGILLAPLFGTLDVLTLSFLVVTATAAAVVGRLESLPLTLAGGLAIGVAQSLVQRFTATGVSRQLFPSIPFIVLFVAVLLPIRWPAEPDRSATLARGGRARPPPRRDPPAAGVRRWTRLWPAALVLILPPILLGREWQTDLATVPPTALIFLSLVLLAGHGGQVSLCHAALAGVGAFVTAHLVAEFHVPFLLAVVCSGLAAVPLGALLAARAAALPPLFLGLATLAFGSVMDEVAFSSVAFSGGLAGIQFERPAFLASPRAYTFAGLAIFALATLLVRNIRRGRTGFALVAMRDSPVGLASLGTSIATVKFTSFCVSAFLAGAGGALLAGAFEHATPLSFFRIYSLLFLALAVIGGITSPAGALIGASMFQLFAPLLNEPVVRDSFVARSVFNGQLPALLPVLFGIGAIGLAQNPGGIVEQFRDGIAEARHKRAAKRARPAEPAAAAPAPAAAVNGLVTFAGATLYHRAGCSMTAGKQPVPPSPAPNGLAPCPICDPATLAPEKA